MRGLRSVSQEDKDDLRLHFPHIDWNTDGDDFDDEEEEEDQDEEEQEEEEEF